MGLPPSFGPVIVALDSLPTERLTLEDVIKRLINDEVRQNASAATLKPDPGAMTVALVASERPKIDRSKLTCFFCDQIGHMKTDCPEKAAWEAAKAKAKTNASANTAISTDDKYGVAW